MNHTPNHRPVVQIERDLNDLRNTSAPQVPDLSRMNLKLARLSAEAQVDPKKRGDLSDALMDLQEAERVMQAIGSRNSQLRSLETELDLAQQAERGERITQADSQLQQAISTYQHSCLQAARSLRELLNTQKQVAHVPGVQSNLSNLRLDKFHIPHLIPMAWQGTVGESMRDGTLPWENTPTLRQVA